MIFLLPSKYKYPVSKWALVEREVLLPDFNIPESFLNLKDKSDGGKRGENAYLKDLTYKGQEKDTKK